MASLYTINETLQSLFNEIEDNGGELTPELEEQLIFTQEEFKSKIKDYANAVTMLENDLSLIKEEKVRLMDLQKSKEKTIDRLKHIMSIAIETFGDTNKNGVKFVDYGTGKVSVRHSESVEVDEDYLNRFSNRFMACLNWYKMQNQLDQSIIDYKDILDFINTPTQEEKEDGDIINPISIDECEAINFNIDSKISFRKLLQSKEGFNLAKALIEYNDYTVKTTVDKKAIKDEVKATGNLACYANIVGKNNVIIK